MVKVISVLDLAAEKVTEHIYIFTVSTDRLSDQPTG